MDSALTTVVSFVVIILLGFIAARVGAIGHGADTLISRIVFRVTLPAAIINAFGSADFQLQLLLLVIAGFVCTALPYAVALLLFRHASSDDRAYYLLNVGGMNIGCFALPFIQALFPAQGVVAACMFDAGNSIMSTGGSFALTKTLLGQEHDEHPVRTILRRLFSSTPFDCYVVLIALGIAGVRLPTVIIDLTAPIANANAFLSLFMLGLMVSLKLDERQAGKLVRLLSVRVTMCVLMTVVSLAVLPFDMMTRAVIARVMWGASTLDDSGVHALVWGRSWPLGAYGRHHHSYRYCGDERHPAGSGRAVGSPRDVRRGALDARQGGARDSAPGVASHQITVALHHIWVVFRGNMAIVVLVSSKCFPSL